MLEIWLNALRSGKYVQGHDVLRKDNRFCVLGVAADTILSTIKDYAYWEGNVLRTPVTYTRPARVILKNEMVVEIRQRKPFTHHQHWIKDLPMSYLKMLRLVRHTPAETLDEEERWERVLFPYEGKLVQLSHLNDIHRLNFKQLADVIEQTLVPS